MNIFRTTKPLQIAGPVAPKFKVGDLVNYRWGANNITYMAIIDTVNDNNNYIIYVIDKTWTDKEPINNVTEDRLTKIKLHPEYNPDLVIGNIDSNSKKKEKRNTMVELKLGIKALQANIDFINANKEKFSDLAIGPKIKQLNALRDQLNELNNTINILPDRYTYDDFNRKLYENMIVKISKLCDVLGLNNEKDAIIATYIDICNKLLSFTGVSLGLNFLYYKVYGKDLIINGLSNLPEIIKKPILLLIYIFIFSQQGYFYHICSNPMNSVQNFLGLFKNNVIELTNGFDDNNNTNDFIINNEGDDDDAIDHDNNSYDDDDDDDDILGSRKRNEYEALSQENYHNKMCKTIKEDADIFNQENREIFNNLKTKLDEINDFSDIIIEGGKIKRSRMTKKQKRMTIKGSKRSKKMKGGKRARSTKKRRVARRKKHNTKRR